MRCHGWAVEDRHARERRDSQLARPGHGLGDVAKLELQFGGLRLGRVGLDVAEDGVSRAAVRQCLEDA